MENDLENNKPSYEELLAELQKEKQKTSLMEKKLEETNNKLEETNNKLERTNNKLDAITNILNNISDLIYNISKDTSIENSIYSMGNIGKSTLGVEECTIYGIDNVNNRLYTSNEQSTREYINPDSKSLIQQAINTNRPMSFNIIDEHINIGDGKLNNSLKTKNVLIVPLENRFGDTIGVAVSKGKANGFKQSDIDAFFSAENGSVGNFFRVAIESKTNSLQATTDKLTSLNNRQGMENFIKASITDRINEEKSVSVAIFDIDKFKNFNDTYGHSVGDDCLKQVANVIKNNLRATNDTGAFRFGGEEFIVVLPTNEEKAKEIIDRIRQKVEDIPLKVGNEEVTVTVSAGVAQMKAENYGLSNEEVISLFDETFVVADTALYQSKENGRNQVTASYEVDFQKIKDNLSEYHNKQNENSINQKGVKVMAEKDFSIQVSNDEDYLMQSDNNSIDVHIESVGDDTLRNMLYEAVKDGDIPKEVSEEVLSKDDDAYYDIYVNFKDDGNDSVSLVITDGDERYYSEFSGNEPFLMDSNFIENVAEEVRLREGQSVDKIIDDISDIEK